MLRLSNEERAILSFLSFRATEPVARLSKALNLREHKVRSILEKLIDREIIAPKIRVDVLALGFKRFSHCCVLSATGASELKDLLAQLTATPNISWVELYSGEYDLVIGVHARNELEAELTLAGLKSKNGPFFHHTSCLRDRYWITYEKKYLWSIPAERSFDEVKYDGNGDPRHFDMVDCRIIDALSEDPLASLLSLSRHLGIAQQTISYRMKRLEHRKVLLGGAYAFLKYGELGIAPYCVFLKFDLITPELENLFQEFCRTHKNVIGLGRHSGEWDFQLHFEGMDLSELHHLKLELLKHFGKNLRRTSFLTAAGAEKAAVFQVARYRPSEE